MIHFSGLYSDGTLLQDYTTMAHFYRIMQSHVCNDNTLATPSVRNLDGPFTSQTAVSSASTVTGASLLTILQIIQVIVTICMICRMVRTVKEPAKLRT